MKQPIKTKPEKVLIECLLCGAIINNYRHFKLGTIFKCGRCNSDFEVVDLEPLSLDWLYYDHDEIQDYFEDDEIGEFISYYDSIEIINTFDNL